MDNNILDSIVNINGCIFFALDKDYKYLKFSNDHKYIMKKIWGTDIEVGISMFEYMKNEDDKIKAKYNFDRAINGETIVIDEDYGDKSLFRTLWRNTYSPIYDKDKNIVGVLVFITELTEYVEMQNRFNELRIFENIINLVNVGVSIFDPNEKDTPIIFVNDSFCEMTGYEKEKIVGQTCDFFKGKRSNKKAFRNFKNAMKSKSNCSIELINHTKDKKPYISLVNLSPIFDINSNLVYYVGIHIDVTQKIEDGKLEIIKKISSGLTHEINTTLSLMNGHLDMMSYDIEEVKDEALQKELNSSLSKVGKSKKKIARITDSLYYINRTTAQKKIDFNICDTIFETIEIFEKKIKDGDIKLKINGIAYDEFQADRFDIIAERKSIAHIWKILFENAIDILMEKDIDRAMEISLEKDEDKLYISICDNGSGIDKDIKEDIFRPLVKGKNHKGVGIGLFTAKTIVDMHQGKISFKSDPHGTEFEIVLNTH